MLKHHICAWNSVFMGKEVSSVVVIRAIFRLSKNDRGEMMQGSNIFSPTMITGIIRWLSGSPKSWPSMDMVIQLCRSPYISEGKLRAMFSWGQVPPLLISFLKNFTYTTFTSVHLLKHIEASVLIDVSREEFLIYVAWLPCIRISSSERRAMWNGEW